MTPVSADLFGVAERLDESPTELLNGGATEGLRALAASESQARALATTRGLDVDTVRALWERAGARLREQPEVDALYPAAAEAAALLYTAAWVIDADSATDDDVRALM